MSDARTEEERRLEQVISRLERNQRDTEHRLQDYQRDIQEQKTYLWEARDEMDHVEKIAARESIDQAIKAGEMLADKRQRLAKIRRSPYFGRFDFQRADRDSAEPYYIGVHHFHDDIDGESVVHDWRAPIASLFYDYETGPARHDSPEGPVDGEIHLKRQFRVAGDRIELMIDSAVHVVDDVLQEELGRASDEGMKQIVATIQRDQNAIIRDDETRELIIQGVAGSGKTSIALHRIAYLLYRFKDTLSSEDILIISPNRVFSDYIANVLPELGEETVREVSMEDVAESLLEGQYRFESFFEQTNALLERDDPDKRHRLSVKATPAFLERLKQYSLHIEKNRFVGEDVWISRRLVPGFLFEELFEKQGRALPIDERLKRVAEMAEKKVGVQYHYDLTAEDRRKLKEAVRGMHHESTLRETYKRFFDWLGEPELFRPASRGRLEYADVFPLIYLKMRLHGIRSPYRNIKHLVIDEMQDYTPVQYAVIGRLFDCRKTILGDAWQSVNPYNASTAEQIEAALPAASAVSLNKSYRSTWQIARFAQRISPNPDLEVIERHGEEPRVIAARSAREEIEHIQTMIEAFAESEHNSLAVITRTQRQARRLAEKLAERHPQVHLLDADTTHLSSGVLVCTAHLAKGLEFDRVIVPQATAKNYATIMDRNLLYVACTRAMHHLALTHHGEPTPLVMPASAPEQAAAENRESAT
ncbi:MAG: 3'-5' exonuclease [Guyparkeria sp.]